MTTIARMKFNDSLVDERVQLAKDASDKLGYKKLAKAIAAPGALLFAMRELGIEPLQTEKVRQYMRRKEKTGMWSGTKQGIAFAALLVLGICSITTVVNTPGPWLGYMCGWLAFSIIGTLYGGIGSIYCVAEERWGHGQRRSTRWDTVRLSEYQGNVPEFALAKALSIKGVMPQAEFGVQRLVESSEEKITPKRDPFLYVRDNDESYYLDVWDEKEYEAKL